VEVDDADFARLRAGEVLVEEKRLDESVGYVRVQVLIEASAETVWGVISSCAHAHRYLNGLEECEVLVDEPRRAVTHHVVDPGWLTPTMDYRFETRRTPYRRMDFELIEGNLKEMEGYWRLVPVDSGVVVEHEVRIKPAAPAPMWLIRRKLRNDLPDMMACIRSLSDGSSTSDLARSDRAACGGPAAD